MKRSQNRYELHRCLAAPLNISAASTAVFIPVATGQVTDPLHGFPLGPLEYGGRRQGIPEPLRSPIELL